MRDPGFIDRADRVEETSQTDEEILQAFEEAHRTEIGKLHRGGLHPSVAWVEFMPDSPARLAMSNTPYGIKSISLGMRSDVVDQGPGFTPARTHLGPADLATADALITAGVASSGAQVLRWAVGRIREHPAYARLQARVDEIGELRAQF